MSHFSRTLLSQGSHVYPTYTFMCIPHIHSITKTHSLTPILFLSAQLTGRVAALDAGEPRNSNGAPEKHLPVVTLSKPKPKFKVQLEVKVPHVMDAQKPHYIEYIWLKDEATNEVLSVSSFRAADASPPTLVALVDEGRRVVPMLHCNLHGLWEGEAVTATV